MVMFDEEVISRRSFWRRSDETLEHMSAISATVHSLMLSGGIKISLSQIKRKLNELKDHAKLFDQVLIACLLVLKRIHMQTIIHVDVVN